MKPVLLLLIFPLFSFAQGETLNDCFDAFFNSAAKVKNTTAVKILTNKKSQTLASYLKENVSGLEQHIGLKDLDSDKIAELVIYNFTGGAHCCDEIYIFRNTGVNQFTLAAKLFAGNTCISGTTFLFDFAEPFGYFYTCYACELEGKKKGRELYERIANISLQYKAGKMTVVPGDVALKEKLLRNLRYIKSLGWDGGAKDGEFDDGRRKALAQALAVYYFSFGKNITESKSLFSAAYPYKDAAAVWKDFAASLANIQRQNSF